MALAKRTDTPNFGALLDTPGSEIERPKPLPQGTYTTIIQGLPRYDKSSKKQTEFVEFTHKFLAAGDDVDEESLTEALTKPDGSVKQLTEVTMRNTFYLVENALWRLKDFLGHAGIDTTEEGKSLRNWIEETPGRQVGVFVQHVPTQDGSGTFAQIGRTVAVE